MVSSDPLTQNVMDSTAASPRRYSEEFLLYEYKVTPCSRRYPHDWASCTAGHQGERAKRRDIRRHAYAPIACDYAKQKQTCPRGDNCPHAHNLFEYWLHPARYRTELCQYGANCQRMVCFYAHNEQELRTLDPSLPAAEVCWSAGAAFNRRQLLQQPPVRYNSNSQQRQRQSAHDRLRHQQEVELQQQIALEAVMAFRQQLQQQQQQQQQSMNAEYVGVPGSQMQQQVVYVPTGMLPMHSSSALNPMPLQQQQQAWLANATQPIDTPGLCTGPVTSATPNLVYVPQQQQQQLQQSAAMQPSVTVPLSARTVYTMQPDLPGHVAGLQQQHELQQLSNSFSHLRIPSDSSSNWSPLTSSNDVMTAVSLPVCSVASPSVTLLNSNNVILNSQVSKPHTEYNRQGLGFASSNSMTMQVPGSLGHSRSPGSQPIYTQGLVMTSPTGYNSTLTGTVPWNTACPQGQQLQQQQLVPVSDQQLMQPYV